MQYDVIMCVTCEEIYLVVASLCHDHTLLITEHLVFSILLTNCFYARNFPHMFNHADKGNYLRMVRTSRITPIGQLGVINLFFPVAC